MSSGPFKQYENSRLWAAVQEMITELAVSREITVNTAPEYVVGYLCRELVARKFVAEEKR
ncbi:MAG: hypothetical protein JF589_16445 [Gemmatimonadetes bacterium]|nr:hypothetical protein [Gemmatimonadota bacterium]